MMGDYTDDSRPVRDRLVNIVKYEYRSVSVEPDGDDYIVEPFVPEDNADKARKETKRWMVAMGFEVITESKSPLRWRVVDPKDEETKLHTPERNSPYKDDAQ